MADRNHFFAGCTERSEHPEQKLGFDGKRRPAMKGIDRRQEAVRRIAAPHKEAASFLGKALPRVGDESIQNTIGNPQVQGKILLGSMTPCGWTVPFIASVNARWVTRVINVDFMMPISKPARSSCRLVSR